ncbi:MAG: hypothetical protein IIC85_04500 [Chloroflexi bacterium]|nr:hypothetical protein [Chloroflexota bacterium]
MINGLYKKLLSRRVLNERIYRERLSEPFIYNIISIFVFIFGNITKKIDYDLVPRQPYAYGLMEAFKLARGLRVERLVMIEFGVASGAGLLNLCELADKLGTHYGVEARVVGFDTGTGMPPALDYRDHPEKYLEGDYMPVDSDQLRKELPLNCDLIFGDIAETLPVFLDSMEENEKIGFVSVDVDYYSSAKKCLAIADAPVEYCLPRIPVYLDDVNNLDHNEFCGELLAVKEYNERNELSKISKMNRIRQWRIFKNAIWLDSMYWIFKFDHPYYSSDFHSERRKVQLSNPYLKN